VRIGTLIPEIAAPTKLELPDGQALLLEPLVRRNGRLGLDGFDPCAILLNNDLSAGVPDILKDLHEQTVIPPLHAGWHVRRKSRHFAAYDRVAGDFAQAMGIDPWLINPDFAVCGRSTSTNARARNASPPTSTRCSPASRPSTRGTASTEPPFVIVKADAGTYGMGIMTVRDASEVKGLNRKQRNKMAVARRACRSPR
jgi:glutamate--cysteine ligase